MKASAVARLRVERSAYKRLLEEAIAYEAEAFETGDEVQGGDLVEWFSAWRHRVMETL